MIQRWCIIVACCFPGILCVQGAVWHVADCRHQCFLFASIPHFFSFPFSPCCTLTPTPSVLSFLSLSSLSLPPSSLAAVCLSYLRVRYHLPDSDMYHAAHRNKPLFCTILFCSRGADKEERGLQRVWPFFSPSLSFPEKQAHTKALAWIKQIICQPERKICTQDFSPFLSCKNKKLQCVQMRSLWRTKYSRNTWKSQLILNVHVFLCFFFSYLVFFHQISHSVPLESDQSVPTSNISPLLLADR